MVNRIRQEVLISKPLSPEVEAFLNVQRTASELMAGLEALLKPHGISEAQYNVLRILRGAGPDGFPCGEIGDRMVARDPDVTRLIDRLEKRGLVERARSRDDRRVVRVKAAQAALELLANLDKPVEDLHKRQFAAIGSEQITALISLLEGLR